MWIIAEITKLFSSVYIRVGLLFCVDSGSMRVQQKDEPLAGTSILGFVGILNGMKPGAFSYSMNARGGWGMFFCVESR